MAIRDQLTVPPPAESPDSGNLRILDELVSVSESAGLYETTATPRATR